MSTGYSAGVPGYTDERFSNERDVMAMLFAPETVQRISVQIVSTATDAGNSPTTVLRPGLILGRITSSGKYTTWSASATDGSQVAECVLLEEVNMLDPATAAAADRYWSAAASGRLKAGSLINLDYTNRAQLVAKGFSFDDGKWAILPYKGEVAKAADYTVVASDNGMLFTTLGASGAIVFTLPALTAGLTFTFLNLVDQNMTITSAEGDNIVAVNDLSADSVAYSTSSMKIGARCRVTGNAAGTKWLVENLSPGVCTVTVAT